MELILETKEAMTRDSEYIKGAVHKKHTFLTDISAKALSQPPPHLGLNGHIEQKCIFFYV